jgi:hypothetical protein
MMGQMEMLYPVFKRCSKMIYSKRDFEIQMKTLPFDGFEFRKEVQGFIWKQKVDDDRVNQIILGYKSYPGCFYLQTPSIAVIFLEIENQVNALYDKYEIKSRYGDQTIHANLGNMKEINYEIFNTEINSRETFNIVASEIEKIVSNGALPFFEKYKDVKTVSEEISKMSEDEISNFVSGIVGIKVPLIKKLGQSSDYLSELQQRKKFYSEEVFKYPQYFKDHDKVFNELFSEDLKML